MIFRNIFEKINNFYSLKFAKNFFLFFLFFRFNLKNRMAHLIQDGFVVNDAKWKLGIFITDLNKSKDILVRGDLTIGNLMMQLVEQMGIFLILFFKLI